MGRLAGLSETIQLAKRVYQGSPHKHDGKLDASKIGGTTAERMARAKAMRFKDGYYHGSTHDITSFRGGEPNPESHFGAGHYISSSADDAGRHYAGEGPDLTNRIQRRAEELASELDLDYDDPKVMEMAKSELKGSHDGAIYPLMTREEKPFDISSDGDGSFLTYDQPVGDAEDYMDEAALNVYESDYDDVDDYTEAVREAADELAREDSYNLEPEGELVDFMESIINNPLIDEDGKWRLIESIREEAYDGGISGNRLDEIMRETEWYAEGDTGGMINNEVYRQALEDAGFDSVIHDADIFSGMDVEPGTTHKIIFDPENIRSVNADFNPELKDSANLMAGVGGAAVLGGAALSPEDAMAAELDAIALQAAGGWQDRRQKRKSKWAQFKESFAEPAATIATGLASMPVQGLAGIGALAQGHGIDQAVNAMGRTGEAMTYIPQSEAGMESLGNVGQAVNILGQSPPAQFIGDHIDQGANWAADNIHPAAGTALKMVPEVIF